MEDLIAIYREAQKSENELKEMKEEFIGKLRVILWGAAATVTAPVVEPPPPTSNDVAAALPSPSPQQRKKRVKRLSSLHEDEEREELSTSRETLEHTNGRMGIVRTSNSKLLEVATGMMDEPMPSPAKQMSSYTLPADENIKVAAASLQSVMPPPAVPIRGALSTTSDDPSFTRPQRAAKLRSEKNLKEPKLNNKLRRPSKFDGTIVIKQEPDQNQMQTLNASSLTTASAKTSMASNKSSDDSIVVLPPKANSLVEILSDDESTRSNDSKLKQKSLDKNAVNSFEQRQLRIKIKREKVSLDNGQRRSQEISTADSVLVVPPFKDEQISDASAMTSTILSSNVSVVPAKRGRKKKNPPHKPIKVERFSDIKEKPSPISSRTRKGSIERNQQQDRNQQNRAASVYEDAIDNVTSKPEQNEQNIDNPPTRGSTESEKVAGAAAINETISVGGKENATITVGNAADATFCTANGQTTFIMDNQNPNATVTLSKNSGAASTVGMNDATFDVPAVKSDEKCTEPSKKQQSLETAKKNTKEIVNDSLMTEDDSFERPPLVEKNVEQSKPTVMTKAALATKLPSSNRAYKMPTRTNELFNPLIQSPLKLKVAAFEHAHTAAVTDVKKAGRPQRTKENSTTTPVIGKVASAPALGRFLTPTQSSNVTLAQVKKAPNSASKAMPFPKTTIASNLKSTNSTSSKTLSRENSGEEFRKGLNQLAEERKRQRELKHLHAAQQREAKERERAERVAKLAKEREERRLQKQMEMEIKKRELEEIQRKMRQQEEAASKQKATSKQKAVMEERELLMQMKQQSGSSKGKMLPPPTKMQSKYTFEMLHEDDSTDDEGKTTYKRPPPPNWSRSNVRGPTIIMQQYWPTEIIDNFFSVQPMTPNLKHIFPNIDARHLKRNSSVLWSTPPRYSELPKY